MDEKQVRWTQRAIQDKLNIYEYWDARNKSTDYSEKLESLFEMATRLISQFPHSGKPTSKPNIRVKIVRDYLVFYKIQKESINIITIWDSRRDPRSLKL